MHSGIRNEQNYESLYCNDEMYELEQMLPIFSKYLKTPLELHKFPFTLTTFYLDNNLKDEVIDQIGINKLPFVKATSKHNSVNQFNNTGGILLRTRCAPAIHYIKYYCSNNQTTYLIAPKGQVFGLYRYFRRQLKKFNEDSPLILDKRLKKEIYDNTIGFIRSFKKFKKYDIPLKKGILLHGSPGNGKTKICRWLKNICQEKNIYFANYSSADIEKAYHGNTLNTLFNNNIITFFDDIDISYLNRKSESGGSKIACALLSAMDGVDKFNCVRVFTTNERIKDLDEAFLRPGRIDSIYELKIPGEALRREMVESWKNIEIDKEALINYSMNLSFAELEYIKSLLVYDYIKTGRFELDNSLKEFERTREPTGIKNKLGFTS